MTTGRRRTALRRTAIGKSAEGMPRTYRILRKASWTRRLTVLLRRFLP